MAHTPKDRRNYSELLNQKIARVEHVICVLARAELTTEPRRIRDLLFSNSKVRDFLYSVHMAHDELRELEQMFGEELLAYNLWLHCASQSDRLRFCVKDRYFDLDQLEWHLRDARIVPQGLRAWALDFAQPWDFSRLSDNRRELLLIARKILSKNATACRGKHGRVTAGAIMRQVELHAGEHWPDTQTTPLGTRHGTACIADAMKAGWLKIPSSPLSTKSNRRSHD